MSLLTVSKYNSF